MADMKKNPVDIQGKNTGKQYSDETGELREGKAQGHPENVDKSGAQAENKKQINKNESERTDNSKMENRGSDERSNRDSQRSDSSL